MTVISFYFPLGKTLLEKRWFFFVRIFLEMKQICGNRHTPLSMEIFNWQLPSIYVLLVILWLQSLRFCNCDTPLPAVSMHGVATGICKTSNMEIWTREQRIQVFSIRRVSTFTLWHHRRSETNNITNMIVSMYFNINWFLL